MALEQKLYDELIYALNEYVQPIQLNAGIAARLDVLLNFANTAIQYTYRRPELFDDAELSGMVDIKEEDIL